MGNIVKCSIIIYDDFGNVLISQRGKCKKNTPEMWSIFGKDIKGKETNAKCIDKAIGKDLKCNIFELTPFKEYVINEENGDSLLLYTGKIREQMTMQGDINKIKWMSKKELEMYTFNDDNEKAMIIDYFNNLS